MGYISPFQPPWVGIKQAKPLPSVSLGGYKTGLNLSLLPPWVGVKQGKSSPSASLGGCKTGINLPFCLPGCTNSGIYALPATRRCTNSGIYLPTHHWEVPCLLHTSGYNPPVTHLRV